jgi:hypothetical protein
MTLDIHKSLWVMYYDNDSLDKTTDLQDICQVNKVAAQSLVSKLSSLLDYIANIKLVDQYSLFFCLKSNLLHACIIVQIAI